MHRIGESVQINLGHLGEILKEAGEKVMFRRGEGENAIHFDSDRFAFEAYFAGRFASIRPANSPFYRETDDALDGYLNEQVDSETLNSSDSWAV